MLFNRAVFAGALLGSALALATCTPLAAAQAKGPEKVLYRFTGQSDGANPATTPAGDKAGNLYGTAVVGGIVNGTCSSGCGVVYKLAPDGTETTLYSFTGGSDGYLPYGGVIRDKDGNLYGTTLSGGTDPFCAADCGTVYKLAPDGTFTLLHSFAGGSDGSDPYAGLIADKHGNLYGVTAYGGDNTNCGPGCGAVFKISPKGKKTVLYAFRGYQAGDGYEPFSALLMDRAGNLYGETQSGGIPSCNCGVVYRIAPDGTETVLHIFGKKSGDGVQGNAPLIEDESGNLYGTTVTGGSGGYGTVYKLAPSGKLTILYNFTGGNDGGYLFGGLVRDDGGNLYGMTHNFGAYGYGAIFKVAPDGTQTVLHAFAGGSDGAYPNSGPIANRKVSRLYGVTYLGGGSGCGGSGCGTVFSLKN